MVERGGWYDGEKGSRVLQNQGEKVGRWKVSVVLERNCSQDRRENHPTVASQNLIKKARERKRRRAQATQNMALGKVFSSSPTEGGPSHTWDTSDRYVARRFPSTRYHHLQGVSISCLLEQLGRAKWHRGGRGPGGRLHGEERRRGLSE